MSRSVHSPARHRGSTPVRSSASHLRQDALNFISSLPNRFSTSPSISSTVDEYQSLATQWIDDIDLHEERSAEIHGMLKRFVYGVRNCVEQVHERLVQEAKNKNRQETLQHSKQVASSSVQRSSHPPISTTDSDRSFSPFPLPDLNESPNRSRRAERSQIMNTPIRQLNIHDETGPTEKEIGSSTRKRRQYSDMSARQSSVNESSVVSSVGDISASPSKSKVSNRRASTGRMSKEPEKPNRRLSTPSSAKKSSTSQKSPVRPNMSGPQVRSLSPESLRLYLSRAFSHRFHRYCEETGQVVPKDRDSLLNLYREWSNAASQ